MSDQGNAPKTSPRGWRRKWRRVPAEERRAAVASLGDLFGRRRLQLFLVVTTIVSLIVHAAVVFVIKPHIRTPAQQVAAREDTYLSRVMEKDRARKVSREVKDRLTMPPPPPEPEAVVERAMSESLTDDVAKITGKLLPMALQNELAQYIKTSLKDELAIAASDIAEGKLTKAQIEGLHREFQRKAHAKTIEWRKAYLEEHQIERAAMSTTEWYEKEVSQTLFGNMQYALFRAYHRVWGFSFGRSHPTLHWGRWGFLGWNGYDRKLRSLRAFVATEKKKSSPGLEDAERVRKRLKAIHGREVFDGRFGQWFSWKSAYHGYLDDFQPHRGRKYRQELDKKFTEAWEKAFKAADAYVGEAESGADAAELKDERAACFAAAQKLLALGSKFVVPNTNDYVVANQAIRSRVFRGPARERMYKYWTDELVAGVSPLIRDFARSQFKKGIIRHKDGVGRAMKDFPKTIIPLVKRDVARILPQKIFNRIIFHVEYAFAYRSKVTGDECPPSAEDIRKDEAALAKVLASWPAERRKYVDARAKVIERLFLQAIDRTKEAILTSVLTGNLLFRNMGQFIEGVDYADKVQEKLNARAMAMKGRGQDLAKLTEAGVPDTSAPLVALMLGASRGHGANLEPVPTTMQPAMITGPDRPEMAVLFAPPVPPPSAAKWGLEEQASVEPRFGAGSPRFEAIPFLTKFPALDGRLLDWGKIRPLVMRGPTGQQILVYAAWNYQGFFFGYEVKQDREEFYYPSLWRQAYNHNTGGIWYQKVRGVEWAYKGDYFRLVFDTLDARNARRGEPHTQEFTIFPMGTEGDPTLPGMERLIKSRRDAQRKQYRDVKSTCKLFAQQPPPDTGPDGSGPYRVSRRTATGYVSEVFIPRSLFNVPVFAPGWYIGFDCAVATGVQGRFGRFRGQAWAGGDMNGGGSGGANAPIRWGDLLLLGTDPRIIVQEANSVGRRVSDLVPGRSYLLTVVDPDRNVSIVAKDTVLVSAEVNGARGDVEVFILNETKKNSGIFRGFINTQPGLGREMQGVLEIMALQEVRFGYVDVANARGRRNVISEMKLPVSAPVIRLVKN